MHIIGVKAWDTKKGASTRLSMANWRFNHREASVTDRDRRKMRALVYTRGSRQGNLPFRFTLESCGCTWKRKVSRIQPNLTNEETLDIPHSILPFFKQFFKNKLSKNLTFKFFWFYKTSFYQKEENSNVF